jgi:alpha 1,2-mannosyltransferase
MAGRRHSAGAIFYLTQGARHSSYGQSTLEQLQKSVRLLYQHYNHVQRDDVVFLHTGDVDLQMQQSVLQLCGEEARFVQLAKRHFELPPGVDPTSKQWLFPQKFSVGYRHMIRFFTVGIWEVAEELGYTYIMRLDDDAYIYSPITYNLFASMAERGFEYGFRLTSWESGEPAQRGEFHSFVREYALKHRIQPQWGLAQSCPDGKMDRFTLDRCGSVYTIYNNFFISKVSFWRRPDVRAFLQHIDASKTIYYNRWGDANWHSVALQLFLPRKRLHMFDDFTYEHTSRKIYLYRGKPTVCFQWGGIALSAKHVPSNVVLGRARALTSINMCSRARGDVNRCFFTPRSSGRLLGVFAGTVTAEPPEVLRSYCLRLRAEKEPSPNTFCDHGRRSSNVSAGGSTAVRADPREFMCAPRRKLLNTSVASLFEGRSADPRTFRHMPTHVDSGLNQAVLGTRTRLAKELPSPSTRKKKSSTNRVRKKGHL